jgi:uncharacterized protein
VSESSGGSRGKGLRRREFLQHSAVAAVGVGTLGLAGAEALAAMEPPRVRSYRMVGKTGIRMSDISFGTGGLGDDPGLIDFAFDRGINYFDTADSYPLGAPGVAETAIGKSLAGKRDKVFLTTKTMAPPHAKAGDIMKTLEGSLRRLKTDHVDIYLNHGVNDVRRLLNPGWFEFARKAKEQGKIRFSGMSGHGGNLIKCLNIGLTSELLDVMLVAHNFGQDPKFYERFTKNFDLVAIQPGLPAVMKKAHAKGVGVIVMKTLMGAKLNDMRPWERPGGTTAQAAFRWVLSNPDVDALVVTMKDRAAVDEYLGASGQSTVREADLRLLDRYLAQTGADYCRHGCDACADACPYGVEIAEVLRTRMYATHYEDRRMARAAYAEIRGDASPCLGCADTPCVGSCPHGLDVPGLTGSTPRILGLD